MQVLQSDHTHFYPLTSNAEEHPIRGPSEDRTTSLKRTSVRSKFPIVQGETKVVGRCTLRRKVAKLEVGVFYVYATDYTCERASSSWTTHKKFRSLCT